ncbi:MAG: DNA translocase FtsK [Planctomycetes bacterium]|nr:DNA translocase FtsK [Planctomycetota bacterium]
MTPRDLLRELQGVALLGLGAFSLVSVASFDPADLPGRVAPARGAAQNLGGSLGAWLSAELIGWVGTLGAYGAAGMVFLFAAASLRRALPTEEAAGARGEPVRRVVGALVIVLTLAVVERVLAGSPWGWLVDRGLPPGGIWGLLLEHEATRLMGGLGAPLAAGLVLGVGLMLLTDRPLRELVHGSVEQAQGLAGAASSMAADAAARAEDALAVVAPPAPEAPAAPPAPRPAAPAEPVVVGDEAEEEQQQAPEPCRDEDDDLVVPVAAPRAQEPVAPAAALPPVALLAAPEAPKEAARAGRDDRGRQIEDTLQQFKVQAKVVSVENGPSVTLFALELGRGVKVQRVASLLDNLALTLRVPGIRLQAPIPGTSWVGLEVPNEEQEVVRLRELVENPAWRKKDPALPIFLGKDSAGRPLIADLAKMPHLLIAGATGSGKSVCINSIIVSLLLTKTPRDVQLILIDPKQVEMTQFAKVPHLAAPVVTDMRKAGAVLEWAVKKMEERYGWLARAGVRHIREYNELGKLALADRHGVTPAELERKKVPWKLPYLVLVVDELNDLMMIAQKEVEASITRLAQKSRAVGIHVVLATQRPSVDVITGVIKSNLPARIAFRVTAKVDSRTILDASGADKLLGMGDMLFLPPGRGQPMRALGALVTDEEVAAVVKSWSKQGKAEYAEDLLQHAEAATRKGGKGAPAAAEPAGDGEDERRDPVYDDAVRVVLAEGRGSVSLIQRKLELGYGRAARLLDLMAEDGLVGPANGSKPREVKLSLDQWETRRRAAA